MRIKCPNSDIYLELPGDRTDMKFTCPACHKVHRVKISITTPGEEPAPAPKESTTRSVTRDIQPHIPKKYATGAYPPVVDIPIDANFVLLDGSESRQGVDLRQAAVQDTPPPPPPPPLVTPPPAAPAWDGKLSERQTEIIRDHPAKEAIITPPPEPESPAPAFGTAWETPTQPVSNETSAQTPPPADSSTPETPSESARGQMIPDRDGPVASPLASEDEHTEPADTEPAHPAWPAPDEPQHAPRISGRRSGRSIRTKPKRKSRAVPVLFLFVLLGAGGFLGWQHYLSRQNRNNLNTALDAAETAWRRGDMDATARNTGNAESDLRKNPDFHTPRNLFNRFAVWSGWFEPLASGFAGEEDRIASLQQRIKSVSTFRRGLDPSNARQMAALLAEASATDAGGGAVLTDALQRTIINESLLHLEAQAQAEPPEELLVRAERDRNVIEPLLSDALAEEYAGRLDTFIAGQRERMDEQIEEETAVVAAAATAGESKALSRYQELERRLARLRPPETAETILHQASLADRAAIEQLSRLSALVDKARESARTVLSRNEGDESDIDSLQRQAEDDAIPNGPMAKAASALIDEMRAQADDLQRLRMEVYGRVQSEMRRGRSYPGTRLAWTMLRIAFDDPQIAVDPDLFHFDSSSARMQFTIQGMPALMDMNEDDYETRIRATIGDYNFTSGWSVLAHKPLLWMTNLAEAMRDADVPPDLHTEWEVLEGPGAPLALGSSPLASTAAMGSVVAKGQRHIFFDSRLLPVTELPRPEDARKVVDAFRQAATRLHDSVMAEESISPTLRQALKPVLMGTYQQPDPRDYFDSAFCRRLIEADYLETYIKPMPPAIQRDLDEYRAVLGKLEAGYDEFTADIGGGARLVAIARPDADFSGEGKASDQDPETGESLPRLNWRVEEIEETIFYSPMPSRFVYAFMLADHYPGRHKHRPAGVPEMTEVWHTSKGFIASYTSGSDRAVGDEELWNAAIAEDLNGRYDPTIGPPGWNFPLHVLERDDQGDPVTLATLSGTVKSPDFSGMHEEESRRRAEDAWLDSTAATLSTPGELGLIFHQFFRYCSDSPLPELPNLIGSHYGLSDTHQTVYESLERRWVGRLIGDCDDLAEFFQVLTRRQGKLSHVMQLPGHAACGYVEKSDNNMYRFIVLQTGPVMQFVAPTLNDAVEIAYRSFDRGDGVSHMTTDAVPLLLRFADEETRTPFVLSARIYGDAEYAETMIRVQAYWHEHVYSAALRIMEDLVKEDQEIGNIKELGSLYERVGFYDKSTEMRYRELEMVKDQPQAAISTLLEIVQLHLQEKDKEKALEALGMMEERMLEMIRRDDAPEFFRAMSFRSYWAMFLSRLGQPARAWKLVKYDATMTKRQLGRIAEPVLRTLVVMYDRMCMQRDAPDVEMTDEETKAMAEVRHELDEAFGRGYFKSDDSYNTIIGRYFVLGRYAISDIGREEGLSRVQEDGPYPTEPKDQTRRTRGLSDDDWGWFRITPQLYLALAMEMLDQEEYPELYAPEAAKPILEDVARAIEKGTGLGSDVAGGDDAIKADLALSFLNRDLDAFRRAMTVVKDKDYASLYDDAALTFGLHCGLIPLSEFPKWIEVFHEFFPGSQHYFKVVYRAIDKENYDYALLMAEATARFFPDKELLRNEAEFIRSIIPGLKQRKLERGGSAIRLVLPYTDIQPAA